MYKLYFYISYVPTKLATVIISKETPLNYGAFYGVPVNSISLSEDCKKFADKAFYGSGINTFEVSEHVEYIGSEVMKDCTNLVRITLNCSVMGSSMFQGCTSLERATLNKIAVVKSKAFSGCTSLTTVVLNDGTTENKITTIMILKNNGGYFLKQSSTFFVSKVNLKAVFEY